MFIRTLAALMVCTSAAAAAPLRVGTFDIDASPEVGSPLAYDPTAEVLIPLSCRGVVLIGDGKPVVLCSIDWLGIANGSYTLFRESLAKAAGTDPSRVAVHAVHQHDAPQSDLTVDALMADSSVGNRMFDNALTRDVVNRVAEAVKKAIADAKPVTYLGLGEATIDKVASNRRILGPDGKVQHTRYTATRDPALRAMPVGTIDPKLKMISLWDGDEAVAVLSYYATHPQSYYRTGKANPDFPGIARNQRQKETGVFHVHFNGAGGNIGAGKWNDGSPENRQVLTGRVAGGMKRAFEATKKQPISAEDMGWESVSVKLPVSEYIDEKRDLAILNNAEAEYNERFSAARNLITLKRADRGIDIGCLSLANARVLQMPGELFVEYQLAAQKMRPDLFVAMAAYGEYGMGYIGTEIAYSQGGYETSPQSSRVGPGSEKVLTDAMRQLLKEE